MATENPLWGAPRIHGELLKLEMVASEGYGVAVSAVPRSGSVADVAYIPR